MTDARPTLSTRQRVVAGLYLLGVVVFLLGVALRIIGGGAVDALGIMGVLMNAGAWPIAVAGAIVDLRGRRAEARRRPIYVADRAPHD